MKKDLPDLSQGVPIDEVSPSAPLSGRVGDDEVIVVRSGDEFFAVGAHCTHYHGPLADGLVVGETVRCPWHHACFSLRTGEALRAPALDSIQCWRVDRQGHQLFVREKIDASEARQAPAAPSSIVILGGGAAGLAAADMLRRDGYDGTLTMVSADDDPPCDRPNLSKDYLAGTAKEEWMPLRDPDFYLSNRIDLLLKTRATAIDVEARRLTLNDGRALTFDKLLLATGADPVRLNVAGAASDQIRYLRTFADSRALVAAATPPARAVVIGASFIGLEVAASLRQRGLDVDVVAPEQQPLERVLGADVGAFVRRLHESHDVRFHLGTTVSKIDGREVALADGTKLDADLVVAGVGVRPAVALAEQAGLSLDRGVVVNEFLETSAPGIYAAGDIARWPDPHSGVGIRVEHWVVAERQGQVAAKNMLGHAERFDQVPFFWSQHYDVTINYVGHAETWDRVAVDGTLDDRDCTLTYIKNGKTLAVATIGRDQASLEAEARFERGRL